MRELTLYRKIGNGRGNRVKVEKIPDLVAVVNDLYYQMCLPHRWTILRRKNGDFLRIRAWIEAKDVSLHHFIFRLAGFSLPVYPNTIDHISRDVLDCRLENLREASKSTQQLNQRLHRNSTSGCKGVSWSREKSRWVAQSMLNRKSHYLGSFSDKEDAARAVNAFYKIHHPHISLPNASVEV